MNNSQKIKMAMTPYVNSDKCVWSHVHDSIQTNSNKDKIISDYKIHGIKEENTFKWERMKYNLFNNTASEDDNGIINIVPSDTTHADADNISDANGRIVIYGISPIPVKDRTLIIRMKLNDGDPNSYIKIDDYHIRHFKFSDYDMDDDGWITYCEHISSSVYKMHYRLDIYNNGNSISIDTKSIKFIPHSSMAALEKYSIPILASPEDLLINSTYVMNTSESNGYGWKYLSYPGDTTNRYQYDFTDFLTAGEEYTIYFKIKDGYSSPSNIYILTNDLDISTTSLTDDYGLIRICGEYGLECSYLTFIPKEGCVYRICTTVKTISTLDKAINMLNKFEFIRLVKGTPRFERIYIDNNYVDQYIDDPSTAVIQKNVYEYRTGIKLPELYQFEGLTTYEVLEPEVDIQVKSYLKHFWSEAGNPLEINSTRNVNVKDYIITNTSDVELGENYNLFDLNNSQYQTRYNATYSIDNNNIMSIVGVGNTSSSLMGRGIIDVSTGKFNILIDSILTISVKVRLDELGEYDDTFEISINNIGVISENLSSLTQDDKGFTIIEAKTNKLIGQRFSHFTIYCNANNISVDLSSISISYEKNSIPILISQKNLLPYDTILTPLGWHKPTTTMPNGSTSLKYIYSFNDIIPYNEEITLSYMFKDSAFSSYLYLYSNDPAFSDIPNVIYSESTGFYSVYLTTERVRERQITFTMNPDYWYYVTAASSLSESNMIKWLNNFEYIKITKAQPVVEFIDINSPLRQGDILVKSQNRSLKNLPQFEEGTIYEIISPNKDVFIEVKYL